MLDALFDGPTFRNLDTRGESRLYGKGMKLLREKAFLGIKMPREREPKEDGFSAEEVERFFDWVAGVKGVDLERVFDFYDW